MASDVRLGDWVIVTWGFRTGLRGRVVEIDDYGARIRATNRPAIMGEATYENPAGQHFCFDEFAPLGVIEVLAEIERLRAGGVGARLRGVLQRARAFVARRGSSG